MTLRDGLADLGVGADEDQIAALDTYRAEVALWNRKLNLVADAGGDFIARHLLDVLAPLPFFAERPMATLADVGSGAGLPGIPLAIMLPDVHVTLIERSGRRADFLRNAVILCGLRDRVTVVNRPLKEVDALYDCVAFRAFREIGDFIRPLLAITAPNGFLAAYKGRMEIISRELKALENTAATDGVHRLKVPGLEEERHIVFLRRIVTESSSAFS